MFPDWRGAHHAVHGAMEMAGALIGWLVAWFLVGMEGEGKGTSCNRWIAGALVGMATLDALHALTQAGNLFVWLHSTATFAGGVLFSLVLLPSSKAPRWWPRGVLGMALILGLGSMVWPSWVPDMVRDGSFQVAARLLNFVGGLGLFAAAAQLVRLWGRSRNSHDALFALHCGLFGAAAVMFEQSALWDLPWWGWHVLRLVAYVVALMVVLQTWTSDRHELAKAYTALERYQADVLRDMTERVRTQEELQESRVLLQTLVEHTPAAVAMFDTEMRYLAWSKRWLSDYRLGARDLKGRSHYEVFPEISDEWKEIHKRCLAGATERREEDAFPREDGALDYVRWVVQPWRRASGEVGGVVMFTEVITERILATLALKESEERFQSFMNQSPLVAWIKDDQFRYRYVNAGFEQLFGMPAEKLLMHEDSDIMPREVAEQTRGNDRRVLECGEVLETIEKVPGADGMMRHWLVHKFPLERTGEPLWVGGTAFDLTERLEAEAAVRRSEEQLRLVASATQDAIWDLDLVGETSWWNEAHDRIFGGESQKCTPSWDWWIEGLREDERDQVAKSLMDALEDPERGFWSGEYHFVTPNGEERFIQDRAHITRDETGKAVRIVGSLRDQSALEQVMKDREQMERKIQEAQKLESLGVMAGGIAHDFNNLLTAMLGNVSLIKLDVPRNSPHLPLLEDVEKAAVRAADLCRQMLAYAGKGRFVVHRLNLNDLIRDLVQLLKVSINKSVHLQFQLAEDLPKILADASQINQIAMNLVINASEAIGEREGVITLTTGLIEADQQYLETTRLVPEIPPGPYVFLEVTDTGGGMDKDTLDRIFDPFFTTKFTGRGLGLAAVQGIVRGHRGSLKVYSEKGVGTTFKILLPVAAVSAMETPAEPVPASESLPESGGIILVVDDESPVRSTSERVLARAGFQVLTARDGEEGLEIFKERLADLRAVMLDLTMPRMDGVEAFRLMRLLAPQVPVLLMSGYNEQAAIQRFTGKGLAGFIQKPFTASALLGKLDEVLRSQKPGAGAGEA